MINQRTYTTTEEHTATRLGSGGLAVLATPALVAFMENAAFPMLEEQLEAGYTSVGTAFAIDHLAACLVDRPIEILITDYQSNGRKHDFKLEAYCEGTLLARATHTRFIVDAKRFVEKLDK